MDPAHKGSEPPSPVSFNDTSFHRRVTTVYRSYRYTVKKTEFSRYIVENNPNNRFSGKVSCTAYTEVYIGISGMKYFYDI